MLILLLIYFLLFCSIFSALLSHPASLSLCLYVSPHLNILLHLVPLLPPSVLLVCFLSISIFLTLSQAPSYSFGVHPFLPLPLHSLSPQRHLCFHVKSLFSFVLNWSPPYFLFNIKLPVDFCFTLRILLEAERDR